MSPSIHTEIASMTWEMFDKRRAENPLTIIPSGAVEVYGPHLPLGSDTIVAQGVARLVAEKTRALLTPAIPVGYSADLMSFPGTLFVTPEAFRTYIDGVARSLVHWGLKKILFLNTHAGNVAVIDRVAEDLTREFGARCMQVDWWRYSARVGRANLETGDWAVGHAGELGTSVLLYLAPDLVNREAQVDFIPDKNPWPSGLTPYIGFRDVTSSGVLGRASAGSLQKGEAIVSACVEAIVEDCRNFFD